MEYRIRCEYIDLKMAISQNFGLSTTLQNLPPTDRPMSVHNGCVIEVFGGVFVLPRCVLDLSVGVVAFAFFSSSL